MNQQMNQHKTNNRSALTRPVFAVAKQRLTQRRSSPEQPALHSPGCQTKNLAQLLVLQTTNITQNQNRPVLIAQRIHRSSNRSPTLI